MTKRGGGHWPAPYCLETSPVMRTLFVSHAYADDKALARLLASTLPGGAEPVVFPAIEITSSQRISDELMGAIRTCDGLVHLASRRSAASVWVQFERNFALRLGKPVFAFNPLWRRFRADAGTVLDPIVAVNWNNAVPRDAEMVRRVAHHLFEAHKFEIRGNKHGHIDNDLRQMLDSGTGLAEKMAAGGVGLLFLSNEGVCGGWHDWADPFAWRRAKKDFEPVPSSYIEERFAALDNERCLPIWLDQPDAAAIRVLLDAGMRADRPNFSRVVEAGLINPNRLVISRGDQLDWNRVDDIMVRSFALAFSDNGDFRRRLLRGR